MAEFRINVVVDPSQAARGTRVVDRELSRTEGRARRLGSALRNAFAVIGLGVGVTQGISILADFGQEMSTVRAITQATEGDFRALSEAAQDLGATTRFSASEAAQGMAFLARAGFDANEVLETIEGTLQLAQAGAVGLAQAADIASNVLTGFRLGTDQTARVVDVLAFSANNANTNVLQLGTAMSFVAPVAAGLGLSVETTTAAIGALSDAGIQASSAGTGLRRVLSTLEAPTGQVATLLENLVGSTDAVRVSQVGLIEALTRLRDAGVDTGLALQLFGDRGGPAFEVLSNALPSIVQMEENLQNAEGTAARLARTMDDNLNGALLSVRSAFEGLVISAGEGGATGALRGVFETLATGLRTLANNIDLVLAGVDTLVTFLSINLARQAIPAAIAGFRALAVAIAANPIGFVLTVITATISALVGFRDEIRLTGDGFATLGDLFAVTFEIISEGFTTLRAIGSTALRALGLLFGDFFNDIDFSIRGVAILFARFADTQIGVFTFLFNAAVALFTGLPGIVAENAINAANALDRGVTRIAAGIIALFIATGQTIVAAAQRNFAIVTASAEAAARAASGDLIGAGQAAARAAALIAQDSGNIVDDFQENLIRENERVFDALGGNVDRFENEFAGAGARTAAAFGAALASGLNVSIVEDAVTDLFNRAEARATDRIRRQAEEERQRELDRLARERAELEEEARRAAEGVAGTGAGRTAQAGGLQAVLDRLTQEGNLLRLTSREREIQNDLLEIERDLREQNIMLTDAEREQVEERLRLNDALRDQGEILDQIRGPQEDLMRTQEALNSLYADGAISAQEYNRALLEIQASSGRVSNTLEGGFAAGLAQAQLNLMDVSSLAESTVVDAFRSAEDALVEFAQTGEFNFSGLVDSILSDLLRLTARQALGGFVELLGGGAGGGLSGLLGGLFGRQDGGAVQSGRSFLVGERGPEIFTPPQDGTIIPTAETAQALSAPSVAAPQVIVEPPQVNVRVINVRDENEIPEAIQSPDGEQAILNVIRRNRTQIRELTAQ